MNLRVPGSPMDDEHGVNFSHYFEYQGLMSCTLRADQAPKLMG